MITSENILKWEPWDLETLLQEYQRLLCSGLIFNHQIENYCVQSTSSVNSFSTNCSRSNSNVKGKCTEEKQ